MRKHADSNTRQYYVNRDEHDTRQSAHLQSRTQSGETVDQAHRHQAGRHEGEYRRGKDHLFSSNTTDPQHVKAVLNRLESEAAFSGMSVNRVEAGLVGACEAFRPTDRTRLNEMRAVKNPVCDTPKASSANAGRIERASQKVEKRSRTSRSWFEGTPVERVCKVMPDTVRNCAWQTSRRFARPGRAKQNEASRRHNGQVSEFTKMNHFTDGEWNLRLWRVTEMMLQETIARTTEIVCAEWLDGVARRTPEDLAADRGSDDAIITASRISWSVVATKGIEKERHHSRSVVWRNMTAWSEHETDKCWEEVTSNLTGELDIGVPMTFVSENHAYGPVHRGINFPSSGSDAESNEMDAFG